MKIVKKGRYILNAQWHSHHGKEVEVIMKRKGISPSYVGRMIFHLAFDPDDEFRSEDYDDEFVEDNFRPLEEMTCVLDTTMASEEIMEKFKPYYGILKRKMTDRINVRFIEHGLGDREIIAGDYLCVFYLIDDGKGNPGLTLESDGKGEIMVVEEEAEVVDGDVNAIKELKKKNKKK